MNVIPDLIFKWLFSSGGLQILLEIGYFDERFGDEECEEEESRLAFVQVLNQRSLDNAANERTLLPVSCDKCWFRIVYRYRVKMIDSDHWF